MNAETLESKVTGASRLSLALPARQSELLDEMARSTGLTKNELLRQAVGLLDILVSAREKGLILALADSESDQIKERVVSTI